MQQVTLAGSEERFQRYPRELSEALRDAWDPVAKTLNDEEMAAWVDWGLAIAQQAGRSWEAAREFFKASPVAAQALPFVHLKQWGYWGNALAEESPAASGAYFRASPRIVQSLKPWDVPEWAQLGKKLYGRGRRAGVLTTRYFEVSSDLLSVLSFSELQHLVVLMEYIAERSVDEAASFLSLSPGRAARSPGGYQILSFAHLRAVGARSGSRLRAAWKWLARRLAAWNARSAHDILRWSAALRRAAA